MDSRNSLRVSKCGLGLIISNDETPRVINPNVIESSLLPSWPSPLPLSPPLPSSKKKDPGGIGFIDEMGGGVDGLMSCTESLGFESCDERRVDDDDDDDDHDDDGNDDDHQHMVEICEGERERWRKKKSEKKRLERNKKFPPPLSCFNQNGKPCFYLKSVRKNGRLELTEIKIHRPEILRAVRENGRLRLHFVSTDISSKINEEEEENEEIKQEEENEEIKQEEELEKKVEELWKYNNRVNGEGFRRCQVLVMNHMWR